MSKLGLDVILSQFEKGHNETIENYLDGISEEELCSLLERSLARELFATNVLHAILECSPVSSDSGIRRRLVMFKHCIYLIKTNECLSQKIVTEWIGQLISQTNSLPVACLSEICSMMLDLVKNSEEAYGRWVELFPQILMTLSTKENVPYAGNEIPGCVYKGHVLNSICSYRWHPQSLVKLAVMFREISMSTKELFPVTEKLLRMLKEVDYQEISPLVYQLLLLSNKGNKNLILDGVLNFFNDEDDKLKQTLQDRDSEMLEIDEHRSKEEVRHVEGNVILHITDAVKQDQDLGRDFIKYLKTGQTSSKILTPFIITLGLSIAQVHRFQEAIFDLFKSAINKCYKEIEYQKKSAWVRNMIKPSVNLDDIFTDAVKNSTYEWDHVMQGFVDLGFALMKSSGGKGQKRGHVSVPDAFCSPVCSLGMKILLNTFKSNRQVRNQILEHILNYIVTISSAPTANYLKLLSQIVHTDPLFVFDSVAKIQQVLEYLALLPLSNSEAFMKAIHPLFRISMALKDSLMIVLRKAMFSRHLESRKVAVSGFLLFLKYFKIVGGLSASQHGSQTSSLNSQTFAEVHITLPPEARDALCLELLSTLRRCLSQQADIRRLVYKGLYEVLCRNKLLCESVLNTLHIQLLQYYESNEDIRSPLKLDKIIIVEPEEVILQEPLAHLLHCIQLCVRESSDCVAGNGPETYVLEELVNELRTLLDKLTQRMIAAELRDFQLDESLDYTGTTSVSSKNVTFAHVLLGVYEALMEHAFLNDNFSTGDTVKTVLDLFENYSRLANILKVKGSAGVKTPAKKVKKKKDTDAAKKNRCALKRDKAKKKAGNCCLTKLPPSLLSLNMTTKLLTQLLWETNSTATLDSLRENRDLLRYVVGVAAEKVQHVKETGHCFGADEMDSTKLFMDLSLIAKVTFHYYKSEMTGEEAERELKTFALPSLCLDVFDNVVGIVCSRYKNELGDFLDVLEKPGKTTSRYSHDNSISERIWSLIRKFKRCVATILSKAADDEHSVKDLVPFINIITNLTSLLPPEEEQYSHVTDWVQNLCTEQNIGDDAAVKAILHLFFTLFNQTKRSNVLIEISKDVHAKMRDIEVDEMEDSNNFAIVTSTTGLTTVQAVIPQVDQMLINVDWILCVMKAELPRRTPTNSDADANQTQFDAEEKKVCKSFGLIMSVINELVRTKLPPGVCIDNLLKLLCHLYNTLTKFVKYYVAMCNMHVGRLGSHFVSVVKFSGKSLARNIDEAINCIETSQRNAQERKKGKVDNAIDQAKVLRETRLFSRLVGEQEEYKKFVGLLSKKSEEDLLQHLQHSMFRAYRIHVNNIEEADLQTSDDESLTVISDAEQSNEQENEPPRQKRRRTATTSK